MLSAQGFDEVVAGFTERKEFHLTGGVDDHHLAGQGVELVGHFTCLGSQEVGSKDLSAVGSQIVLVHHLGQRDQISDVKFSVVVDAFGSRVKVDSDDFGFEKAGPALERGDQ